MPTVPNLINLTVQAAVTARNNAGFSAGEVGQINKTPYHTVMAQIPAAGATATAGSLIDIVLRDTPELAAQDTIFWGT
jgi:beta-lactam-binding protein with PASTA domain